MESESGEKNSLIGRIPQNNLLASFSTDNDKSLLCKVMKVYDSDEDNYWIRVKDDEKKWWKVLIDKIKYPELQKDEIIRIKSAKEAIYEKEDILEMRVHSNILKFSKDSKIEKYLLEKIVDNDIDRVINDNEEPLNELTITKELESGSKLELSTIMQIYFPNESYENQDRDSNVSNKEDIRSNEGFENKNPNLVNKNRSNKNSINEDKLYRIKFNVVWYEPNEIRDFIQAQCNNWNES